MKLIWSPTSPFVRKCLIVAHERGLFERLELVPGQGTPLQPNPETRAHNPIGKIPCLLVDGRRPLMDSRVICRYLDTLGDAPSMTPSGDAAWDDEALAAIGDGMMDAGILAVYERRLRPEAIRMPEWVAAQTAKIDAALTDLETRRIDQLDGPLTLGGVAVGAALGYLDLRFPDRDWRADQPRLAAWFEAASARASFQQTTPKE